MFKKKLSLFLQHLAPQQLLTRLAGFFGECRWIWLKNRLITFFVKKYNINLDDALHSNIDAYPNFNSFFTRFLKHELRPIAAEPDAIISPADGFISQIGKIEEHSLFQAKGFFYTLHHLLADKTNLIDEFTHGSFVTFYLSPKDYHRVHMPYAGKLRETIYVPGKLFSVSPLTVSGVSNLFARNERLICIFDTDIGPLAVIFVAAMLVGSINTKWGAKATKNIQHENFNEQEIKFDKGDELGYFQMGSTIILLFANEKIKWEQNLAENDPILMGSLIAKTLS